MNVDIGCIENALSRLACARTIAPDLKGLTIFLLGFGTTVVPMYAVHAAGNGAYVDDTHTVLESGIEIETVNGPFGYDNYRYSERADGKATVLDARNARFIVANSQNLNPTYEYDCNSGSQPVNPYPLQVYDPDLTSIVGGIFYGEVPQESDWKPTYCNSAAIILKDAPNATVDGVRITSAWDGIREASGSPNLTVKNSWLSNVRDDAVENDDFLPLVFEDNLVDGAFQGISIHSGGDITTQSEETIYLYGNVIRIREYLYKGEQQYGSLFKDEDESPYSEIHNTVVAVDYKGGSTWGSSWERTWGKVEACSNNLFLWLSDKPISDSVATPPACFTVLTGAEARAAWARAKQNWIDCHPHVARTPGDPESDPAQCVANTFGGFSRGDGEVNVPVDETPVNVDSDGDGLTDAEENLVGTDPGRADSDGDRLGDGLEVNVYGTNPLRKNTDRDGLNDYVEVTWKGTDPLNPDTDGDGLTDGREASRSGLGTDPLSADTDGDRLGDGLEVNVYGTNPLRRNTDRDGLSDYVEVTWKGTDPLNPDTDGDGLTDGREASQSGLGTDPLSADTDGGGETDGAEVANGRNPLNPADDK